MNLTANKREKAVAATMVEVEGNRVWGMMGAVEPKKKLVPAFFFFLVMAFLDWSDLIDVIKFISIVVMIHMACDYQHQHDFLNLVMSAVIFLLLVGGGLFFYFLVMAFLDWNDLMDGIKFLGMVVLMFFAWVYQIDIINSIFDITKSAIIILLLGSWLYSKIMPEQTEGEEGRNYIRRTVEEISLVLDLHKLGVPPIEIGRRLGMARQTVHNIIQRNK